MKKIYDIGFLGFGGRKKATSNPRKKLSAEEALQRKKERSAKKQARKRNKKGR